MWIIIIIIILIVLLNKEKNKVSELLEENRKLKRELQEIKQQKSFESINILESKNNIENLKTNIFEEKKNNISKKKEKKKIEERNTAILITGAILIVLAAIVFLMSTWYTIPNILKSLILICLSVVFFGISKIAEEKFKLPKAGITFFYIAMAYIPICLFSISFLGLLGDYFSITGKGNFIYLTFSTCITAFIYYIIYKNKNNEILLFGSILSQVLTVILFTLIFSKKIELIVLNLALYNILFIVLTNVTNNILNKIPNIYNIIPYTLSIILLLFANEMTTVIIPINLIVLSINFIILGKKQRNLMHALSFNIAINSVGNYIFWNLCQNFSEEMKILFSLVYIILIFIIQNIIFMEKNKYKMKLACLSITNLFLQILFFKVLLDTNTTFIKAYIISIIQLFVMIFGYMITKDNIKKIITYMIPVYFIISGLVVCDVYELKYYYYIIFSLLTFVIGELLERINNKQIGKSFFIISNIFIILTYLGVAIGDLFELNKDIIYFVLLLIVNIYSYLKTKIDMLKYFSYLNFYVLSYVFIEFLGIGNIEYIYNIIFIICSVACLFVEREKKDIFEFLIYLGSLILYNTVIENSELCDYTAFSFAGYILVILLVSRRILKKYVNKENLDFIESILIALIYIIAIFSYSGEFDGMIFGILIVFMLMLSYINKYGTLFLINIGAILLNVFLLTRKFWFSIPWWIYLLVIGSVLITFAIKNEADEKKNKFKIADSLKKIKDKIEE